MIKLPENWGNAGHRRRAIFFVEHFAIRDEMSDIIGYDLSDASPEVKKEFEAWEREQEEERKKGLEAMKY